LEVSPNRWKSLLFLNKTQKLRLTTLVGGGIPYQPFDCVDFYAYMTQDELPTGKSIFPLTWVSSCSLDDFLDFDQCDKIEEGDWILMLNMDKVKQIHRGGTKTFKRTIVHVAWCVGQDLFFSKMGASWFVFCCLEELRAVYKEADCFQLLE
jgi:hypothetical protein